MHPRVALRSAEYPINHNRLISLMKSLAAKSSRALIFDRVESGSRDRRVSIIAIASDAPHIATSPAKRGT